MRAQDGGESPWSDSGSAVTQMALADPEVLVSNIDQTAVSTTRASLVAGVPSADHTGVWVQLFETGSNEGGYLLESVEVDFATQPSDVTAAVQEHGGVTTPIFVATLANPASLAAGHNKFTAPAGTRLDANTTYRLRIEGGPGR